MFKKILASSIAVSASLTLAGCGSINSASEDDMIKATSLCKLYAESDISSVPGFHESGRWYATVDVFLALYPELEEGAGTIKGNFEATTWGGETTYGSYTCDVTNKTEVSYTGYNNTRD